MRRSGDDWLLTLADGRKLRAPLVVAADGANSAVRRLTGCATREWDYLHHAIVTSVRTAEGHQKTAWQRFTDEGPLAFLPLEREGEHWCSIVWSVTPAEAERLMALSDDAFCRALEKAFEGRLGEVLSADPRVCVPLRQRHAKRYVAEGLALIGDAAHTIHHWPGKGSIWAFWTRPCWLKFCNMPTAAMSASPTCACLAATSAVACRTTWR